MQVPPAVHLPVQSSRQTALHCSTFVHEGWQCGNVPQMMSQLAPPVHAQLESLHAHVAPEHVGDALGPQARAMTAAAAKDATKAFKARELYSHLRLLASFAFVASSAKLKEAGLSIDFGIFKLETKWSPDPRQREAAWALWVELSTRVATQPVDLDEGMLREALESLHELFDATRGVLRACGPNAGAAEGTVGFVALRVLNGAVRPFLSRWHPKLLAWEEGRPKEKSAREHERAWHEEAKCRGELEKLRQGLVTYAETLADLAA